MTVKISKPAVNLREELNELKKPTGVAGEAMLRAETPQEQQALIGVGRRNLIINGDFDVWQRGTSFSANAYTADRWLSSVGTVTKDGAALKLVSTNTDPYLLYKVEDVGNKLAGNKAVLSFYLKTSGSDNRLQYVTFSGANYYHSQMSQLPSELEGYTHWVCPVEITTETTDQIRIVLELHNVSGHTSWLRKVQLELGNVATPFEHRSYGEELALCQRYYWQTESYLGGGFAYDQIGQGFVRTTNTNDSPITIQVPFPVPMRTLPTIGPSLTDGAVNFVAQVANNSVIIDTIVSIWSSGRRTGWVDFDTTSNPFTVGQAVSVYCNGGSNGDLTFDAEL